MTALEHGKTVSLAAGSNEFAILSRGGREYFLIENRRRAGRDASLPDEGLAIWHVDEDGDNSHEQMTGPDHYELSLEQADGRFDLEKLRFHNGDLTDLYEGAAARFADDTVPSSKWWNGTSSNLTIDQISAAGATMTFRALLSNAVTPPTVKKFGAAPEKPIPDNNPGGISDTIQVGEALDITGIKVSVDVVHSYRADLRVTLTTPWGVVIELHPKGRGGGADDLKLTFDETTIPALATLRGKNAQGAWVLTVQDLAPADTGRLERWGLEISSAGSAAGPIRLSEAPGAPIPDHPSPGIERTLSTPSATTVGSIEVSVDISHTWVGDLELVLVSPSGKTASLQNRVGGAEDNLVRTFTVANTPALATLLGEPATGAWRLKVADREAQDIGKLNSWSLLIKP